MLLIIVFKRRLDVFVGNYSAKAMTKNVKLAKTQAAYDCFKVAYGVLNGVSAIIEVYKKYVDKWLEDDCKVENRQKRDRAMETHIRSS